MQLQNLFQNLDNLIQLTTLGFLTPKKLNYLIASYSFFLCPNLCFEPKARVATILSDVAPWLYINKLLTPLQFRDHLWTRYYCFGLVCSIR